MTVVISTNRTDIKKVVQYYEERLELNPKMSQANNNIKIIYYLMSKNAIKKMIGNICYQ